MDEDTKLSCIITVTLLVVAVFVTFTIGRSFGYQEGYTEALDDARLGKPAKYKLVQTTEKWVEVRSE